MTSHASLVARRYVVSGRVQGVGFRYFTQEVGLREGVRGWVRNLMDGRVEAFAQGGADAVTRFERHIRNGPASARVTYVDVQDATPDFEGTGFSVR